MKIGPVAILWVPPWSWLYWQEKRGGRDYLWAYLPDETWWWFRIAGLEISVTKPKLKK